MTKIISNIGEWLFNFFPDRKCKDEILIEKALKISGELLEHTDSTVRWLLHFCEKNNISPPNEYQLRRSVERSQSLIQDLPTRSTDWQQVEENNPKDNRTIKQQPYKVLVPYLTVW